MGLEENVAGALAYFLGFITGIFFLLTEKGRFVRFHAMQSTILSGGLVILSLVLGIIPIVNVVWFALSPFVTVAAFVLWLYLMYQAYQGKMYKLPWIGDISEQQMDSFGGGGEVE